MKRSMFSGLLVGTLVLLAQVQAGGQGTVVTLDDLKSAIPSTWKLEEPSSKLRSHQIRIPKAKGDEADGEIVVFYFGPGGGGSNQDNINRWKKMFIPPQGKSIEDVSKVENFKVGDVEVAYLDVKGTYVTRNPPFAPNAKEERHPDHRMLAVIFASKNGPYFIRLTGPAKTVDQNKKGFDDWLKNFK